MNLTEAIVGAAILLYGNVFVYFGVRNKSVPTDSWSRFFKVSDATKRIRFLVTGLFIGLVGVVLILDGFRLLWRN